MNKPDRAQHDVYARYANHKPATTNGKPFYL